MRYFIMCSGSLQITQAISDVSDIAIKDVRLIRDKSTNTSRRFCFVETITTEVSTCYCLQCICTEM